jgi:hypothetical protein
MDIPIKDGESDIPSNAIDSGSLELQKAPVFESGSLGSVGVNGW